MSTLTMSEPKHTQKPPAGLTTPVMILLVVSAVVVVAAMTDAARRQNHATVANSVQFVRAALDDLGRNLGQVVQYHVLLEGARLDLTTKLDSAWLNGKIGPNAAEAFGVSSSLVVDADDRVRYAMIDGQIRDDPRKFASAVTAGGLGFFLERARAAAPKEPQPKAGLLRFEGGIHIVVAAILRDETPEHRAIPESPGPAVVLAQRLDQALLDEIGDRYRLNGLSIQPDGWRQRLDRAGIAVPWSTLPLIAIDGTALGDLTWRVSSQSQSQLNDVIIPVTIALLVMIGLAWVFVQRSLRMATELERGRQLAQENVVLEETARKLLHSETRYRSLFEESPISIREEDWSGLKRITDRLRTTGVRDLARALRNWIHENRQAIEIVKVVDINKATVDLYHASDKQACIDKLQERGSELVSEESAEMISALAMGEYRVAAEIGDQAIDGSEIVVRKWVQIPEIHRETWSRTMVTVEDITERKRAEDQLKYLANYDSLTGLANRESLNRDLQRTIALSKRSGRIFAVLFLDLDDFKSVNDTLGHDVGDLLLKAVAERLQACLRDSDELARNYSDAISRFGGDEFTIVLSDIQDADGAAAVAERIIESVSSLFEINGAQIYTGISIGISVYPDDGENPEQLLKSADLALYRSKKKGQSVYQFHVHEMDAEVSARKALERDLRHTIEHEMDEMSLQFQPQLNLATMQFDDCEALLRWQHQTRGAISPTEFIPVAENSSLILPIGEWALLEACRQVKSWQAAGLPQVSVAVNVSAVQMENQDVVGMVRTIIDETGLEPRYLHLEITESTVMQDLDKTFKIVKELYDFGVDVHLDDFGTGHSSLSYLKSFPIQALKIDQSFIGDCTDNSDGAAIVRAIIRMGHALNQKVIAEGVETAAQFDFLRAEDCDAVQGYYFGRPMVPSDFLSHLLSDTVLVNGGGRKAE